MTAAKYFVDGAGAYLGAFIGQAPESGVEVLAPPLDARQVWDGETWSAPPPIVPEVVSRLQAFVALDEGGYLDQVEQYMDDPDADRFTRLAWRTAQEFRRNSPTVALLASVLGLTEQQLDALFIRAAQIEA